MRGYIVKMRICSLVFLSLFFCSCDFIGRDDSKGGGGSGGAGAQDSNGTNSTEREAARARLNTLQMEYGKMDRVETVMKAGEKTLRAMESALSNEELEKLYRDFIENQLPMITNATKTAEMKLLLEDSIKKSNLSTKNKSEIKEMADEIVRIAAEHESDFENPRELQDPIRTTWYNDTLNGSYLCREFAQKILTLIKDNKRELVGNEFNKALIEFDEPLILKKLGIVNEWLNFNYSALGKMKHQEKIINQ